MKKKSVEYRRKSETFRDSTNRQTTSRHKEWRFARQTDSEWTHLRKRVRMSNCKEKNACLAVKSSNGGGDKSRDSKLGAVTEKEEPPTLEELRMWGESFDKLMKCAGGRKIFREFLRSEYSEENMLFYLACEDLKKERIPELIEEKARLIYEDYISILSPKEWHDGKCTAAFSRSRR
ncbi:regulator of G-protein signaling 20-like [Plakobranchus ocellatus]|uniref:Regulator of G-protein signaling 20-like n=1 Tax=Plakobranchus ocellatus TaxID=259542 RepID=A0AAV4CXM2_9GAST|nr:regulator of G-protein signaling 20-like [Plakobranchus ocellatus]